MEQQLQEHKTARRKYAAEFKRAAVDLLVNEGYSLRVAARRLGVPENSLFNWKRQLAKTEARQTEGTLESVMAENRLLRDRNRRLEMECDILKKAATYFATVNQPDLLSSHNTRTSTR